MVLALCGEDPLSDFSVFLCVGIGQINPLNWLEHPFRAANWPSGTLFVSSVSAIFFSGHEMSWEFESQQSVFECFWSLDRPVIFMGHTNAIIACLSTREMAVSKMWYPPKTHGHFHNYRLGEMFLRKPTSWSNWFPPVSSKTLGFSQFLPKKSGVFPIFSHRNRWHLGQGRNTKVESTRGSRGAGRAWEQIGMVFPQRMVMDGAPVMWTLVYSRIWFTVW
jgi:hypothetical protein